MNDMKKVIFTVIMMLMTAGCMSDEAQPLPTPDEIEVVESQWQNDSYQFWNLNPMSSMNTTLLSFNTTGNVTLTLNLTAFFHEPPLWSQGFTNYTVSYGNASWSVQENKSQTNHTYNISYDGGNITIEIQSNGSDNPADSYPGDYFIAETYLEVKYTVVAVE